MPGTTPPGAPTQVAHPIRAVVRTVVQVGIPTFLTLLLVVPLIIEAILQEPSLPDGVRAWLVGLAAAITAISGVLTRIMAIPALQPWLERIGLGTGVDEER